MAIVLCDLVVFIKDRRMSDLVLCCAQLHMSCTIYWPGNKLYAKSDGSVILDFVIYTATAATKLMHFN